MYNLNFKKTTGIKSPINRAEHVKNTENPCYKIYSKPLQIRYRSSTSS